MARRTGGKGMYIGTLTLCAVIAVLSGLALVMDAIIDRLVFEPISEDFTDYGEE